MLHKTVGELMEMDFEEYLGWVEILTEGTEPEPQAPGEARPSNVIDLATAGRDELQRFFG